MALWPHYPLATASGRCDVSGAPGAWVVALTSGVRVAALPSYGGVLSYIIHHAFSAEPLARRGKARWAKEESVLEVSAGHPARHLPGANLGA